MNEKTKLTHGGANRGQGRKPGRNQIPVQFSLSLALIERLQQEQAPNKSAVAEAALWRYFDGDHLECVLKRAYMYAIGDMDVSGDEISNDLCDALCNIIGDEAFVEWRRTVEP